MKQKLNEPPSKGKKKCCLQNPDLNYSRYNERRIQVLDVNNK